MPVKSDVVASTLINETQIGETLHTEPDEVDNTNTRKKLPKTVTKF